LGMGNTNTKCAIIILKFERRKIRYIFRRHKEENVFVK
jgi:hypothetical protein